MTPTTKKILKINQPHIPRSSKEAAKEVRKKITEGIICKKK